jgi:hypothetical protein
VATFSGLSYNVAETMNIAFSTNAGSFTATSNDVVVSPAAASQLVVTQQPSSTATAGVAFATQPVVKEEDAFGNVVTSDSTHTVTAARGNHGSASLQGSNLTVTLASGVATFSGLSYNVAETMNIAFSTNAGSFTVTSNDVLVSAATATHFSVSAPASATAGSAFNFTVTAQDQFNNTATGYSGTVHFTSSDANASVPADTGLTNGTGSFSATLRTAGNQTLTATDTGNSNVTGTSNTITVSPAAVTHFTISAPSSATAGSAFNFTVTAEDAFNNTVTGYGGTVHFTSSDGNASLPADSTLTNGIGTFSATLKTAGNQTLTGTDTGNSSITGTSNTITVNAATATHFVVSAPSTATAGSAFNFTVTALDQFNNTAAGYTGTVHFSSSDGQAVLPADTTLTNGTGTFSATLKTAGSQTLTATDTTTSSITGTSNSITVSAAAANHFVVSAPAAATAGSAFSILVTAQDQFSNTVTGYSGTVHFSSSDGNATLPADTTLTNGVGAFNATLRTAGNQTITATDTNSSSITGTSSIIAVSAAAATHFTVSAPASVALGAAFNFTVTAEDQFNNTDTAYSGTAHYTSSDVNATLPINSTLTNGTGTFSATLNSNGNQTITATDTVTSSITGTSNTIAVQTVDHFLVSAPSSATAGSAFNFTVTAVDTSNQTVPGYSGTVHFNSSDGQAVLPANTTLTNGTGTFSATLKTAGSQTVTATDTVTSSVTGSATITVSAAAATHFTVSAPSSATAGSAFTFTVTAQDQFNNTDTNYNGTFHFTSSDGNATLPANSTLTGGTGSFSATLKTAGSQTLTATDTGNSSITGTSNAIAVSAAAATHFTVSAPSSATAGSAFTFTVTALDQFNNTATSYNGTFHFTCSDGNASLPADSTLTNGTGSFSATLTTAGNQTITAADTTTSSITGTSNTINVVGAAATHFVVNAPVSATAGSAFNFAVTAEDQFNNTATGYGGTVHFTSSDGTATLPADSTLTNGVAAFSATLKAAGNQTITATDTTTSSITGTSNTIAVSPAAATHFVVSAPASATAGSAFNFLVTAQDQFSNTATGYDGTIHFTSSDGNAVLPFDTTLTNGVGSFSATLKTAGNQTLTATDTGNSSLTGTSNVIAVSAAAATHFVVTAPATATAGSAVKFLVTAEDAFSNTDTGYSGTVHFTSSDGNASLPADTTLAGGTGSFNATLRTAGVQTVTATDTGISSVTGTSGQIDVTSAAATHFTVSAPATATAASAFSFTVTALDQFNNTDTSYNGTFHFTSSDGTAVLPADSTLSNGTGTFSATLKTGGNQTLTATDTTSSSITGTSNTIVVSAVATVDHFQVSGPSSATAGTAFSFTVTALDASNQIVTGYNGTMHFTSSDGTANLPTDSTLTGGTGTFSATFNTVGKQTVTATDTVSSSVTGTSGLIAVSTTTAAPAITGQAIVGNEFTPLTNVTVATFTYGDGSTPASSFTATIAWGDGTTTSGNVIVSGSVYSVEGTNTYTQRSTTLGFANGVYQVTITVKVAGTSTTGTGTARILPELMPDGTQGTPTERYVSEVYRTLLNRQVDAGGLANWSNYLDSLTAKGVPISQAQYDTVLAIELDGSHEYLNDLVQSFYQKYLGRAIQATDGNNPTNMVNFIAGSVAAYPNSIDFATTQVRAMILSSPEYFLKHGSTTAGLMKGIYQDVLGRTAQGDAGAAKDLARLNQGQATAMQIAMEVLLSDEGETDLVLNDYTTILNRAADASSPTELQSIQSRVRALQAGLPEPLLAASFLGDPMQEFYSSVVPVS